MCQVGLIECDIQIVGVEPDSTPQVAYGFVILEDTSVYEQELGSACLPRYELAPAAAPVVRGSFDILHGQVFNPKTVDPELSVIIDGHSEGRRLCDIEDG